MRKPFPVVAPCVLLVVMSLGVVAYWPGLHGSFLFDDFANLPSLGAAGPIDTWAAFWRYITSGIADPTGRPLTLLTFLIDAQNWPAEPYPFKRTNLILHLLNGILLTLLLCGLGHRSLTAVGSRRIELAAVFGAGFWMLHPLLVSTTLYVVQREAMLPTTFTLVGLLAWLNGRTLMARGNHWRGTAWIIAGLGGGTALGLLSKANGILLPSLALIIEFAFLRVCAPFEWDSSAGHAQRYRRLMLPLAWFPTLLVASYLLKEGWSGVANGISSVRPWTMGQRLLTEPRVLLEYLDLLWLPRPFTPGLFNDHVQASTSLWSPGTTLPASLAILLMITGTWLWRRRWPAVSLAILFYFVGQSLESSTIALELYFEHRNYLPSALMFWPLALWLCGAQIKTNAANGDSRNGTEFTTLASAASASAFSTAGIAKFLLAVSLLLGLTLMTHARASLWGNSHDQALLWAQLNPESPRAQANAAQVEMSDGRPDRAVVRLKPMLSKAPDEVQLALSLFSAECQLGNIDPSTLAASRKALAITRDPGILLVSWFDRAMAQTDDPACPELNLHTLSSMLGAALTNPYLATNPGRQQDIYYLMGRLALKQGNADMALTEFNRALDQQVRTSAALKQAALLGASRFPKQGLAHLDHLAEKPAQTSQSGFGMPRVHAWVLQNQNYWPKELAHLQATLRDDAAKQASLNQ